MKLVAAVLTALMFGVMVAGPASAELTVKLEVAADGLTAPLNIVSPPDGTKRRFITEQIGVIKILMPDGKILDDPFLNIRHRIPKLHQDFDERGLLGLTFHPDFKNNGRFFVAYSGTCRGTPRWTKWSGTRTPTTSPSTTCPRRTRTRLTC